MNGRIYDHKNYVQHKAGPLLNPLSSTLENWEKAIDDFLRINFRKNMQKSKFWSKNAVQSNPSLVEIAAVSYILSMGIYS